MGVKGSVAIPRHVMSTSLKIMVRKIALKTTLVNIVKKLESGVIRKFVFNL